MKYLDPKADLTFKKIFGNHPKSEVRVTIFAGHLILLPSLGV